VATGAISAVTPPAARRFSTAVMVGAAVLFGVVWVVVSLGLLVGLALRFF
jgi:hypothetical protein